MATYPVRSTRYQRVTIAQESTWGTNPASGGFDLNPRELALPAMEQAMLERADSVRTGYLKPGPISGVKGPAGPEFTFDLRSWLAARATAGTDANPAGSFLRLFRAALGEGANTDTDGYTAGQGRVCGGSTVASVASGGGNDQIVTVNVQAGHGSRFHAGDLIVIFHGTVPYPMLVTGVSTDALTVMCGPSEATSGIAASDVILGTHQLVLPVTDSASGVDLSLTTEIVDSAGVIYRWSGCSGNATIDMPAADIWKVMFQLSANSWEAPGALSATLSGGTAWALDSVARLVGRNAYCRLGAAGDDGTYPNTLLEGGEHWISASLDFGITRNALVDQTGSHGRAGNPITEAQPRLTIEGYKINARYGDAGNPGSVPTRRSVCIVNGDATNGGFGILIPDAVLVENPTHADASGMMGQTLVFAPYDHSGDFPQFCAFAF